MSTTYRCGDCGVTTTTDDDLATCDGCDGVLFDDEIVQAEPAPVARSLKFRAAYVPEGGYMTGDDRTYDVVHRGVTIGIVERAWLPSAVDGGEPVAGFGFRHNDGRGGEGRTRAAAVRAAWS